MTSVASKHMLTLMWHIENVTSLCGSEKPYEIIESPLFTSYSLEGRTLSLFLHPKSATARADYLDVRLFADEKAQFPCKVDCEWAFIGCNGLVLVNNVTCGCDISDCNEIAMPDCPTYQEVFGTKRSKFIQGNILIIRCRMWKSIGDFSNHEFISGRTRLEAVDNYLMWPISGGNAVELNKKYITPLSFEFCNREYKFLLRFILDGTTIKDATCKTELVPIAISKLLKVRMKVSILDKNTKVLLSVQKYSELFKTTSTKTWIDPKFFSTKDLFGKKSVCLNNGVLNLLFELTALGFTLHTDRKYYGPKNLKLDPLKPAKLRQNVPTVQASCKRPVRENGCQTSEPASSQDVFLPRKHSLSGDFLSLFVQAHLCDFRLFSGSLCFLVHKVVLSARSPVFNDMLADMESSSYDYVHIVDIESHTLSRMLSFLYTDTVDPDLDLEGAIDLYCGADKYKVPLLKSCCSSILQSKTNVRNVNKVLALAKKYEDQELMSFVHSFIQDHLDDVMGTMEWAMFLRANSSLAVSTMTKIYNKREKHLHQGD